MSAKQTTRLRKVACPECGYVIRVTRSWMLEGLPNCHCGGGMVPTAPEDLAFLDLIGPDDMSAKDWNAICRANGWTDFRGSHGTMIRMQRAGTLDKKARCLPAAHCAFAGCGLMVASGADHCSHGHAQHAGAGDLIPF